MQKKIELRGISGKIYIFDVYTKSAVLPEKGGVYIVTYSHPRGHRAGFQINILSIGTTDNLDACIREFRQKKCFVEECWNYTGILCLDDSAKQDEDLKDLQKSLQARCVDIN